MTSERTEPEEVSTIKFFASVRFVGNLGESLYLYGDDPSSGPESSDASTRPASSDDEVEMNRVSLTIDLSVSCILKAPFRFSSLTQ